MDPLFIVLRIVHVLGGVMWAGTAIFNAVFLFPAMRSAGPAAAKVTEALMHRKLGEMMGLLAVLSAISGVWLYSRVSVGFNATYMHSHPGMAYGIGGACAILGGIIGGSVIGPSMLRAATLSESAMKGAPEERDRWLAAAQAQRIRAGKATNVVAGLLTITALAMAVGRYI